MRNPIVSIVIIFFNPGRQFFAQTVASVFSQTLTDWELLLVDDGSSDGTEELAKEYCASGDTRIRYICHPGNENRGTSASRNLGLSNASGKFVTMLDADDVWRPGYLEHFSTLLDQHVDASMVVGLAENWHSWQEDAQEHKRDSLRSPYPHYDVLVSPLNLVFEIIQAGSKVPQGVMFRRDLANTLGGYEESFTGACEDMVFYSKLAAHYSVYVTSASLYRYRQHRASFIHQAHKHDKVSLQRLRYYKWLNRQLLEHGLLTKELKKAIAQERWNEWERIAKGRYGERAQQLVRGVRLPFFEMLKKGWAKLF